MDPDVLQSFLTDRNDHVRGAAVRALVGAPVQDADVKLIDFVADNSPEVHWQALNGLAYQMPWLRLVPYPVRQPSAGALSTPAGRQWQQIRKSLQRIVDHAASVDLVEFCRRLFYLPGILPDLIDVLTAAGSTELAAWVAKESDIDGSHRKDARQVLLAPTYRCNQHCSYCYARHWDRTFGGEMKRDDLSHFIQWCRNHDVSRVILAGGEPTVYRYFPELVSLAARSLISLHLASNCLYPSATASLIRNQPFESLTAHFNAEHLSEDADALMIYKKNIVQARDAGVKVMIRYTITDMAPPHEWHRVLDLAEELDIDQINYALAFGNAYRDNRYFRFEGAGSDESLGRRIVRMADEAAEHGRRLHLCKPIPLCQLSKEAIYHLVSRGALEMACAAHLEGFSRNLTVNPDLSTFPCNALPIRGPILTLNNDPEMLGACHKQTILRLLKSAWKDDCRHCLHFFRGHCNGSCLAEKIAAVQGANGVETV